MPYRVFINFTSCIQNDRKESCDSSVVTATKESLMEGTPEALLSHMSGRDGYHSLLAWWSPAIDCSLALDIAVLLPCCFRTSSPACCMPHLPTSRKRDTSSNYARNRQNTWFFLDNFVSRDYSWVWGAFIDVLISFRRDCGQWYWIT